MASCVCRKFCALVALLFSILAVRAGAAESETVLLGDAEGCIGYEVAGPKAGSLNRLVAAGSLVPLAGPVFPWLASGTYLASPTGCWNKKKALADYAPALTMHEGGEAALLTLPDGLKMRTRLLSAGHGVWLWELALTNTGKRELRCQAGLSLADEPSNREWLAADGMYRLQTAAGTLMIGAVSTTGVVWSAPGTGPLYRQGPEEFENLAALAGTIELSPAHSARLVFVLALGSKSTETGRRCRDWMRLVGRKRAFSRAKVVWENWLAEGRTPVFTDRALQVALLRRLRSLAVAAVCPGLAPPKASELLDCAEAMRIFGRDREAAAWLAQLPALLGQSVERLARTPAGRDLLLRYASLVARQTIASGRLAGELDLVDQGLDAISQLVTSDDTSLLPGDAVQLEGTLEEAALLMKLARRFTVSERMLTNAGKAHLLAERLWSQDARAWTNAAGIPDPRVLAEAGLKAGEDLRYDLHYRHLRSFEEILSSPDQALLVVAAARAFDLAWYRAARLRWEEAAPFADSLPRTALWLRIVAEGCLAAALPEEEVCSGFRLEALYRLVLEMRHVSTRVASSFVFRELRSRIRQHLGQAVGRDEALVSALGVSLGEVRAEIARHGLPDKLEQRQVFSRLDRVDRILAGMIALSSGTVLDTGVRPVGRQYILESEQAKLELPEGFCLARRRGVSLSLRPPRERGDQPQEGRLVIEVESGTRTISIVGSLVLLHPRPLALHLVRDSARSGRVLVENRGAGTLKLTLIQSSPAILKAEGQAELESGCLASFPVALDEPGDEASLMVLAESAEGEEIRLERTIALSEVLELDTRWFRSTAEGGRFFALTPESAQAITPESDGRIKISRVVAGLKNRGPLVLALQAGKVDWNVEADGILINPLKEGDWIYYFLPGEGSSRLRVTLPDRRAVELFASLPKRLIIGYKEGQ